MRKTLFVALQYALPKHWLTAVVFRLARIRHPRIKNWLIKTFVTAFDVDVNDVARAVPDDFADFNDFFTRELADGARHGAPSTPRRCPLTWGQSVASRTTRAPRAVR